MLSPVPSRSGRRSSSLPIRASEQVAKLLFLGLQVAGVVRIGIDLERHLLDDLEPDALDAMVFARIVGEDPHLANAEVVEDLGADAVVALVDRQPERLVRFNRVHAGVLQGVSPQLVAESDTAALVVLD